MRIRQTALVAAMLVLTLGLMEGSAFADFCFVADNGVGYQLQFGTATPISASLGTPIVVTGTRVFSTFRLPVTGSLTTKGTTVLIGITEVFDFGSGTWAAPIATTVFTFPPSPGLPAFDTTFSGNGPLHNVKGLIDLTGCPLPASIPSSQQKDPNVK